MNQRYLEDEAALRAAWSPVGIYERHGGPAPADDRPDASMWSRYYVSAVATWPLVALTADVAVDASAERCAVVLEDGFPMRLRATTERVADRDELRAKVFHGLFTRNIIPLVERMLTMVKLDPKVLWCNVAESIDCLYAEALGQIAAPEIGEMMAADRHLLLSADRLPGVDGPNPLRGKIWYEVAEPSIYLSPLQVREMCCICFHIRTPLLYCRDCPLPTPAERAELNRDWQLLQASEGAKGAPIKP